MTRKQTHTARHKRHRTASGPHYTYSHLDELMASTTEPLPLHKRTHQLTRMHQGLEAIEADQQPSEDDWRVCSDAVNLMETLLTQGNVLSNGQPIAGCWMGCDKEPLQLQDSGLLDDAVRAMAMAGRRQFSHGVIRLDGPGMVAVRGIIEDYAALLDVLPARAMVTAHRMSERRLHEILRGKKKPHDVEVMDLGK